MVAWYHDSMPKETIARTARLDPDLDSMLRAYAYVSRRSINEILSTAAEEYLVAHKAEISDAVTTDIETRHRVVLDKLADL